ncbi:MAG: response regulator [Pseudomonadota bacterium]
MTTGEQVLLIEDDELFAGLMADTLQQEGFTCTVAGTLARASELLAGQAFDIVITDIHLPGTVDTPVLDMLARNAQAGTPVIVITGLPSIESAMRSMDMRVFAYRTKPLVMNDLVATVHDASRQARVRRRFGATRERLQTLGAQLDGLREVTATPQHGEINQSLSEYILLLLGNCGENLSEAVEAFRLMEKETLGRPVRQLSRHPEAEMFRRTLEYAVDVLEKTKHSFKSRELAELRQKLETALAVSRKEQ